MRTRTLQLRKFKRFDDLTIDLTSRSTKIVALVGPNGSGKSSVFDAFEELASSYKGRGGKRAKYYKKSLFDGSDINMDYDPSRHVTLTTDETTLDRKSFYIRSAYRFMPRLEVGSIRKLEEVERDGNRPQSLIDTDARLQDNYERLMGRFFDDVYDANLSGKGWVQKNIDGLNTILQEILDIRVSFLGNPVNGEGSLYFEKGTSKRFPYENLSAGEKEVIDLILDLYVKRDVYVKSIICIDEPELHLNTAIQRKMLIELEKLVPESSQLWVATHSIGFLRALQEDLWDKTAVLDFTGHDFDGPASIQPIVGTRSDWSRIFATALEDLTGLLSPKRIIYCEGRPDPAPSGGEQGFDAEIYNKVFEAGYGETLFVSSGGGGEMHKNALLAIRVLSKALAEVEFLLLRDRDEHADVDRQKYLQEDSSRRMLSRREIENFLFDKEVLVVFCNTRNLTFDEALYNAVVTDILRQDLKIVQQQIQASTGFDGTMDMFKRGLGETITNSMAVYKELRGCIFGP
jgi:predicted ATPase